MSDSRRSSRGSSKNSTGGGARRAAGVRRASSGKSATGSASKPSASKASASKPSSSKGTSRTARSASPKNVPSRRTSVSARHAGTAAAAAGRGGSRGGGAVVLGAGDLLRELLFGVRAVLEQKERLLLGAPLRGLFQQRVQRFVVDLIPDGKAAEQPRLHVDLHGGFAVEEELVQPLAARRGVRDLHPDQSSSSTVMSMSAFAEAAVTGAAGFGSLPEDAPGFA